MTDMLRLVSTISVAPPVGNPSGQPTIDNTVSENMLLKSRECPRYTLTVDTPVSVALGPLANVHVLRARATGGKVRLRITTADGSQQAIPVDPMIELMSRSVPITAIDLTRVADTETVVELFLGEAAS